MDSYVAFPGHQSFIHVAENECTKDIFPRNPIKRDFNWGIVVGDATNFGNTMFAVLVYGYQGIRQVFVSGQSLQVHVILLDAEWRRAGLKEKSLTIYYNTYILKSNNTKNHSFFPLKLPTTQKRLAQVSAERERYCNISEI